jgi:hypothetical protein
MARGRPVAREHPPDRRHVGAKFWILGGPILHAAKRMQHSRVVPIVEEPADARQRPFCRFMNSPDRLMTRGRDRERLSRPRMASTGTPVLCETARSAAFAALAGDFMTSAWGTTFTPFADSRARSAATAATETASATMFSASRVAIGSLLGCRATGESRRFTSRYRANNSAAFLGSSG